MAIDGILVWYRRHGEIVLSLTIFSFILLNLLMLYRAYYNTHQNALTECDALSMDIHHVLEQQGRANCLRCFSFNGTGGIWRLDAIIAAGGFSSETVTEDLDMSYTAFIAGYRFVYVPEIPQLLELPPNILAYKQQKNRWNKGFFQVFRKSMRKILTCSHLSLFVRIEAFFHITNPVTSFLGLVILFLSPIMVVVHGDLSLYLMICTCLPCIPVSIHFAINVLSAVNSLKSISSTVYASGCDCMLCESTWPKPALFIFKRANKKTLFHSCRHVSFFRDIHI